MASYDDWRALDTEDLGSRVRELPDETLARLVEYVQILCDSGSFPKETFFEVSQTAKLVYNLLHPQKNDNTTN